MSTLHETVYRNDSVLFNLHESCFTNINYNLQVYFITNFSLTKSRSRNSSLLWNIDIFVKNLYMQLTLKLHYNTKLLYILGFYKAIYQHDGYQHFNFLFKFVTSHCSAYCYELFQTIRISAIKRCKINSNSNFILLHNFVIGDSTF